MSDLHLERHPFQVPSFSADLVVLAGDIIESNAGSPVAWAKENLPDHTPVVFVPGNHDFYGGKKGKLLDAWRKQARGSHVHVLYNESIELAGMRVLGTPLWSGLALFRSPIHEAHLRRHLPMRVDDFTRIHQNNGRTWTTKDMLAEHALALDFLERELQVGPAPLVVSHWPAHSGSTSPEFDGDMLLPYFINHLPDLVGKSRVWIHGHVHDRFDYQTGISPGQGRVVCHPRGYPHEAQGRDYFPLLVEL